MSDLALGQEMHALCRELFPICRSLTGEGFRQSMRMLQAQFAPLQMHEVASGTAAFDWTVPPEWNPRAAWIETPDGRRICDFAEHNLHLLGYSDAVDAELSLEELQAHDERLATIETRVAALMEQAAQAARDTRIEPAPDTSKQRSSTPPPVFGAPDMSHETVDLDIRLLELPEIQPPPDERLLPSNVIPLKAQA